MNDPELHYRVVNWLQIQSQEFKTRPQHFRPKVVAEAVGGAFNRLGIIADKVIAELQARGVKIRYVRTVSVSYFELL